MTATPMAARTARAERDAERRRVAAEAAHRALRDRKSITCNDGRHHETCVGETPGNSGCLCTCHDDARDELEEVATR